MQLTKCQNFYDENRGKTTDRIKINAAIEKIGYQTELSSKDKKIESPCKKTCTNKQ